MGRMLHAGWSAALVLGLAGLSRADLPQEAGPSGHDYPTAARVEYVQECMLKSGAQVANLYKCSCAIDRMAKDLTYDDFVEWGTYARNASLAGERGGVFRDTDEAREKAKQYRALETSAYKGCGLPPPK
ncbi:MAG TPA: hypothetical protein VLB75_11775 [Steroidobacteraceae bacterium]|nr:hypothetical protein [Steroidobacteraceae bacterium]